jgi:hypothetical protein
VPDPSTFISAISTFISAYPVFDGAAVAIVGVFGFTVLQSTIAHRRINGVKIPEDFGTDPSKADQRQRFWQHAMHEDGQFNDRLNFFLVFESILLGIVATLYAKSDNIDPTLWAMAMLGLVITLLWMNVQVYHKFYLDSFSARLEQFSEFAKTTEYDRKWFFDSTRHVLSYVIPLTVAFIWLGVIGVFLRIHF